MASCERLKILISAYACSPYKGSEPGVGWGFVVALAKHHDLWVIVEEEKFRPDIERYCADHPGFVQSVRFHFVRKKRNRLLRRIWPPSYYRYYRRWQQDAFALVQELHREVHFDVVHQLTMVGFREPGFLWQLKVPFVWGPVGGMGYFPVKFLPVAGVYGAAYYLGYNLWNYCQMRFYLRPKLAAQRAGGGLIAATPENQDGAIRFWGCESILLSEVGLLAESVAEKPSVRTGSQSLRLIWVGQHTPGKALNLALKALAKLPTTTRWKLDVLGSGQRTEAWRRLAASLCISERCTFHGFLPRADALKVMEASHVMLITSLRDLTSTVTIEALAAGLPIVCLDHCGFGEVVNDTCGIKVPVTTSSQVESEIAGAIKLLADDEGLRRNLAIGAIGRSRDFSWDRKAEKVSRVYWELGRPSERRL